MTVEGVKCLRECEDIRFSQCTLLSDEFGWRCRRISLSDCTVKSPYLFFDCRYLTLERVAMSGKYSFQYVEGMTIRDSVLDTKDAFWHAKNVTVYDSVVKGEYLGWYSENLRLVRCRIEGTQPLCYCKNLTLIDCEMVGCDLAFENSTVTATVKGHVDSIKSPASGRIEVDSVGEVVYERAPVDGQGCEILVRSGKTACPCCGCKTLSTRGQYDICLVCFWEDDPIAEKYPDEAHGCNGVSLTEAQNNYKTVGACREDMVSHVREPRKDEM
jgi:hypothetical protein